MSMKILPDLYYTDDDEWIRVKGNEAVIGVSDYAQDSLSDIVFLELPGVGDFFAKGETFGVVESVKAAADLLMPVGGEVTEVNDDLLDTPEAVNEDPYGSWLVKITIERSGGIGSADECRGLQAYCEERD